MEGGNLERDENLYKYKSLERKNYSPPFFPSENEYQRGRKMDKNRKVDGNNHGDRGPIRSISIRSRFVYLVERRPRKDIKATSSTVE